MRIINYNIIIISFFIYSKSNIKNNDVYYIIKYHFVFNFFNILLMIFIFFSLTRIIFFSNFYSRWYSIYSSICFNNFLSLKFSTFHFFLITSWWINTLIVVLKLISKFIFIISKFLSNNVTWINWSLIIIILNNYFWKNINHKTFKVIIDNKNEKKTKKKNENDENWNEKYIDLRLKKIKKIIYK